MNVQLCARWENISYGATVAENRMDGFFSKKFPIFYFYLNILEQETVLSQVLPIIPLWMLQ